MACGNVMWRFRTCESSGCGPRVVGIRLRGKRIPLGFSQGRFSPRLPRSHCRAIGTPGARDLRMTNPTYEIRKENRAAYYLGTESGLVATGDVALEGADGLLLAADDPLHEVADGDEADDAVVLDHGQMAEVVLGHEGEALIDGMVRGD